MRNGWFWFKVKVLSFKIRFCNGDSDAQLTPATAHAQTLGAISRDNLTLTDNEKYTNNFIDTFDKWTCSPKQKHNIL